MTFEQYLRDNFLKREISDYPLAKALVAGTPDGPVIFGVYPSADKSDGGASFQVVGNELIPQKGNPE